MFLYCLPAIWVIYRAPIALVSDCEHILPLFVQAPCYINFLSDIISVISILRFVSSRKYYAGFSFSAIFLDFLVCVQLIYFSIPPHQCIIFKLQQLNASLIIPILVNSIWLCLFCIFYVLLPITALSDLEMLSVYYYITSRPASSKMKASYLILTINYRQ